MLLHVSRETFGGQARQGVSRETWWVGGVFCSCSVFHVEHCFWILKLIQLPYVWLVSGSKEAQGGWHVLSAFPPVDVDEFSHWLNKLPCFTWNIDCGNSQKPIQLLGKLICTSKWKTGKICHLTWSSLLTETSYVWGHWISFLVRERGVFQMAIFSFPFVIRNYDCFTWNAAGCCGRRKAGCDVSRETSVWWVRNAGVVSRETRPNSWGVGDSGWSVLPLPYWLLGGSWCFTWNMWRDIAQCNCLQVKSHMTKSKVPQLLVPPDSMAMRCDNVTLTLLWLLIGICEIRGIRLKPQKPPLPYS